MGIHRCHQLYLQCFTSWKESEASMAKWRVMVQGCSLCYSLYSCACLNYFIILFLIQWKIRKGGRLGQEWRKGKEYKLASVQIRSEGCLTSLNKINPRKHALKLGQRMKSENHVPACTMNRGLLLILGWQGQAKLAKSHFQGAPVNKSQNWNSYYYSSLTKNIPLAMNSEVPIDHRRQVIFLYEVRKGGERGKINPSVRDCTFCVRLTGIHMLFNIFRSY